MTWGVRVFVAALYGVPAVGVAWLLRPLWRLARRDRRLRAPAVVFGWQVLVIAGAGVAAEFSLSWWWRVAVILSGVVPAWLLLLVRRRQVAAALRDADDQAQGGDGGAGDGGEAGGR